MISSFASLPIIVIFERHWDQEPKKLLKGLIPKLYEEGYDTLCFEAPQNSTEEELLSRHRKGLEVDSKVNSDAYEYLRRVGIKDIVLSDLGFKKLVELMRFYVSSQRYLDVAEKIKGLPSSILLKEIFKNAKKFYFNIKGIDIDEFESLLSPDLSQRMRIIEEKENYRISTIFKNLLSLYRSGKNVVFMCGALHAENLINKFNKKGMQDKVLYYFPHSDKKFDDSIDDIKELFSYETLKNHTFCLSNVQDRALLQERMIKEIKSNNINYKEEVIGGNSHTQFLSNFFNKNFKAFLRPGYYVDAALDSSDIENCEYIVKKLEEVNIHTKNITLEGRTHLIIRNINTRIVADNIRLLN